MIKKLLFVLFVICGHRTFGNYTNDLFTSKSVLKNYLSGNFLNSIYNSLKSLQDLNCAKDLNFTINEFLEKKPWALAMYDASAKIPIGVQYGEVFQFGNFDQCLDIDEDFKIEMADIKPKYCLAEVEIPNFKVYHQVTRSKQVKNSTIVHWGLCVPKSCPSYDIEKILSSVTGYENVQVNSSNCTSKTSTKYSFSDILYAVIILGFITMNIMSTLLFIVLKTKSNGKIHQLLKAFSIIENLKKLGKASSDDNGLSCINGIKFVSMFFIIAGHSLVFMFGGPILNSKFYAEQTQLIQNAFLINSPLLVDTFLLLSGFLFSRLFLIELEKRKGRVNFVLLYIFRYIRLTPAYLAVIGLYSTWLIKLGDGPLWNSRISIEQSRCEKSWWKNILYINNYYGNEDLCMFQSWYLAADTQLFILAPLIIFPLWRFRRLGPVLLAITGVVSALIPFLVTYIKDLDPTFIVYSDEISDLSANDYFINTYGKSHMRATGYVSGLIVGYLVHIVQSKELIITNKIRNFMTIIAIAIGFSSMFSVTMFYLPNYEQTRIGNAMYAGLHRLGWSIAVGWLLMECVTQKNSALKRLLSSSSLVPFSRLTYCAFLTNGLVELYMAATLRNSQFMGTINLLGQTLSHVALTFTAALLLCLVFESPIHGIEKLIFRLPADKRLGSNEKLKDKGVPSRNSSTSDASL